MFEAIPYRVGIDVGGRSIGFCAVSVDDLGSPTEILNSMVLVHDGGLDPGGQKTATTRLAESGVARRTRRLVKRRRQRLQQLDALLDSWGWSGGADSYSQNPYAPWEARARLTRGFIESEEERHATLGLAMRHIARHRGWRSPYQEATSLLRPTADSDQLQLLRKRVEAQVGSRVEGLQTQAELIHSLNLSPETKIRGPEGILQGKLMQSDNANEVRLICETQQIPEDRYRELILTIFKAKSPKGTQVGRVGKDVLPGQHGYRAAKAEPEFQHYRIASILGNLRLRDGRERRQLTPGEMRRAFEFLTNYDGKKELAWEDVADLLNTRREFLGGIGTPTADGDRSSARPPVDVTHVTILQSRIKPIVAWWKAADVNQRAALVRLLSNSHSDEGLESDDDIAAEELLSSLDEKDMEQLDGLTLPVGRAAYSKESLVRLTARMLEDGVDLHEARKREFAVDDNWRPPAAQIGEPTGNPSVDRVMKGVARWLMAMERRHGAPISVNIEHVRAGFVSETVAREMDRDMNRRYEANRKVVEQIHERLGSQGQVRRSDILRFQAFSRQHGQCLYCGSSITLATLEMDHIVPRAGVGSTNRRDNLVAVCERCNKSKSKSLFSAWASSCGIQGVSLSEVIQRVRGWDQDPGLSKPHWNRFLGEVIARLKRTTEDPEFDGRSMESIAWMANELRHRIEQHWRDEDVKVGVYRGQLTAEARKASGFEGRINFVGGSGKSRLDRRHHAMDAACMALMRPSVAKTLAQRVNIRDRQRISREAESWKEWQGDNTSQQTIWRYWVRDMARLAELFNDAVIEDRIPVMENLRLRLGNSAAHDDTIRRLKRKKLGSAFSQAEMDRAATPALWTALSREPGFELGQGLPENPDRRIRVNGDWFGADDQVPLFPSNSSSILVRGGAVEVGNAIHHARVYRIAGRKPTFGMVRVFAHDLQRHAGDDLFQVELPPQSVSVRDAALAMRKALAAGRAEYLGWIVVGDELLLTPPDVAGKSQIDAFLAAYPATRRWKLNGFFSESKLRLRPRDIAAEGLPEDVSEQVRKIIDRPGWIPAVNMLWTRWNPIIVRRNALGEPRIDTHWGMPTSWHPLEP